ncbi:MAG TPA: hypothetical protein VLI04_11505 [Nocardioidaceae bacterium]|nr:hypothetical protein [Nocardioidaceae bacterium]
MVLGKKYDVPGVGASGFFWTSDGFYDGGVSKAFVVTEAGVRGITEYSMSLETVCTTTPTDAR